MQKKLQKKFTWGVATAAHQVEGNNVHSDWWSWEQVSGNIKNNERSGPACRHLDFITDDIASMKALGVNAYRFSIEWAKVEPVQGQYDDAMIEQYRQMVELLHAAEIEPWITLQHFTFPEWFRSQYDWHHPEAPILMERFAYLVATKVAPRCRHWVTINEPMVQLGGGYVLGIMPPGKKSFKEFEFALVGLLHCHAAMYRALKLANSENQVGFAHHLRVFSPRAWKNPIDWMVAKIMDRAFNWTIPETLRTGKCSLWIPGQIRAHHALPALKDTQDFFGMNYYSRDRVFLSKKDGEWKPDVTVSKNAPLTDLKWEIYPQGLLLMLRIVHGRYAKYSIAILENGIADATDQKRATFIRDHLAQIKIARDQKIPVEGYFHWSLMDNFEWIEGFAPRFGLIEVDYKTFKRTPRKSFYAYAEMIRDFFNP